MTRDDHLLVVMQEEANELAEACTALALQCNRLAVRISKALRFGGDEVQPGQDKTNAQRITDEMNDLMGIAGMLVGAGLIPPVDKTQMEAKRQKVELFLNHSRANGRLVESEVTK